MMKFDVCFLGAEEQTVSLHPHIFAHVPKVKLVCKPWARGSWNALDSSIRINSFPLFPDWSPTVPDSCATGAWGRRRTPCQVRYQLRYVKKIHLISQRFLPCPFYCYFRTFFAVIPVCLRRWPPTTRRRRRWRECSKSKRRLYLFPNKNIFSVSFWLLLVSVQIRQLRLSLPNSGQLSSANHYFNFSYLYGSMQNVFGKTHIFPNYTSKQKHFPQRWPPQDWVVPCPPRCAAEAQGILRQGPWLDIQEARPDIWHCRRLREGEPVPDGGLQEPVQFGNKKILEHC